MFKVIIKTIEDELLSSGTFETKVLAQSWLDKQLAKPIYLGKKAKRTLDYKQLIIVTPSFTELNTCELLDDEGNPILIEYTKDELDEFGNETGVKIVFTGVKTVEEEVFHDTVYEEIINPEFYTNRVSPVYTNEYGVECFDILAEYTYEIINLLEDEEFIKKQVIEKRIKEYGSIEDQLDEIFHDFDSWRARIQSVKDLNPK